MLKAIARLFGSREKLVGAILDHPHRSFGDIYASETRYRADAVTRLPYPDSDSYEMWLQRTAYFDGKVDYWYSFAGDPDATPAGTRANQARDGIPPVEPRQRVSVWDDGRAVDGPYHAATPCSGRFGATGLGPPWWAARCPRRRALATIGRPGRDRPGPAATPAGRRSRNRPFGNK